MDGGQDVLNDFTRSLLAVATVIGALLGAISVHHLWYFYVAVGIAVLYAAIRSISRRLGKKWAAALTQFRNGKEAERWRKAAAEYQERNMSLHDQLSEVGVTSRREGRGAVIGEMIANITGTQLNLEAVGLVDDNLAIVAKVASGLNPQVGGHWFLKSPGFSEVIGVFLVIEPTDPSIVLLTLIETRNEIAIENLVDRVKGMPDNVGGLSIDPRPLIDFNDLREEY